MDKILFSIIAMSFENVSIGIEFFFANGFIFTNTSRLNGPIMRAGFISLNNFVMTLFSIFFAVLK